MVKEFTIPNDRHFVDNTVLLANQEADEHLTEDDEYFLEKEYLEHFEEEE